jgi:hypothetical protein
MVEHLNHFTGSALPALIRRRVDGPRRKDNTPTEGNS